MPKSVATGLAVYLAFRDAIEYFGRKAIEDRYGNLFDMYQKITGENPYELPMRIYPAVHYTMGGLWVDYNLMSNIPGLYVAGEANFSDHGANRLGASALMQGLADGYFVLPYTVGDYLAETPAEELKTDTQAFKAVRAEVDDRIKKLLAVKGKKTVREFHRELGKIMWNHVGMSRTKDGLKKALEEIPKLKEEFWKNVNVPGSDTDLNKSLEMAGRVADYFELGELMARDALDREESCGGHFREESQTEEGEALRDDDNFAYASVWEYQGEDKEHKLNKEELTFENVKLTQRSYK